MEIKNINIYNMYEAILNIRLSFKSKDKSDSVSLLPYILSKGLISVYNGCELGDNDTKLIGKLLKKQNEYGHQERKFLRQILVSFDLQAPLYWWKHFDQYRIAVVSNSESTMHTLLQRELTQDDFEDNLDEQVLDLINQYIISKDFFNANNLLPGSFLQERHITLNYETLRNIYFGRQYHKLKLWQYFISVLELLPYSSLLLGISLEEKNNG